MKEIRTTRMVEQTEVKFIADDGKEFVGTLAEQECRAYERTRNEERVINAFKKLKPKWINMPLIDWVGCENEIISVTVNDEVDYDITIRDYYYIKSPSYMDFSGFESKKPKEFPANIVLVSGCEWVDIFGSEADLMEALKKTIEQLNGKSGVNEKQNLYDEMCRVLTDWEGQEAVDDDLYNMLVKIQRNWETVITARED